MGVAPHLLAPTTTSPTSPSPTTLPSSPPLTITSTVQVPSPDAPVGQVDQGLHGWAIPIATLIAALIAATFLTINEALKRRAEDKRQWDKEVRDLCVSAIAISNQMIEILSEALHGYHRPRPKPTMRERLRSRLAGGDDNPLPYQQRRAMSLYPEAAELREPMRGLKERANLIAPPKTYAAFEALADACYGATVSLHDGLAEKSTYRNLTSARRDLIDAVKEDLRIHTYFHRIKRAFSTGRG
jgi:hypothetical protein